MKRCFKTTKILSAICIIVQILAIVPIPVFAVAEHVENTDDEVTSIKQSENTTELMSNASEIGSPNLTFSIIEPALPLSGTICVMFDPAGIISCSYVSEGLQVVRDNDVLTKFTITANDEFGKITVSAEKDSGIIVNKTIYTYRSGDDIFVSDVSKDGAWHSAKYNDFSSGLITTEEWHDQYSSYSLSFSEDNPNVSFENYRDVSLDVSEGNIVVRGKMSWTTQNNDVLPLRFTKVELREREFWGSDPVATTYTDENGYYCFVFDPDEWDVSPDFILGLFVRTYVESETTKVVFPFWASFNYFDSNVVSIFSSDAREINISRTIVNDGDNIPYRLIYIQQGMVVGERFAAEMGMETNDKLYVYYVGDISKIPYQIMGISEPSFLDLVKTVNVNAFCYDRVSFIGHSHYNNFATTIHEYGHFVENRIGTYGSAVKGHLFESIPAVFQGEFETLGEFISDCWQNIQDYNHPLYENNFGKTNTTKSFQMELTWSESWSSVFAKMAFQYYYTEYVDYMYDEGCDYETINSLDSYDGEAQEYAVTSFLWDLYDDYSSAEPDDNVSMSEQSWWNLTAIPRMYSIQDFTRNILENRQDLINGVGELLINHNISPEITRYSYVHGSFASPYIVWRVNGGTSYPNNIFRIAFYDNENNLLGITDEINSYTSETSYRVPTDLWNSVIAQEKEGMVIYAVVYGYRTGSFVSGPYFSSSMQVYDNYAYHQNHDREYTEHSQTYHTIICECGYETLEQHGDYTYSFYSTTQHRRVCKCGEASLSSHIVASGGGMIKRCVDCGALVNLNDTPGQLQSVIGVTYITDNGSYVRSDGIIVLSDVDYELYLSGELDLEGLIASGGVTQ